MTAKLAIDWALLEEQGEPIPNFTIPGMDEFLAVMRMEDPLQDMGPEEAYAKIENFVMDHLDDIIELSKPWAQHYIDKGSNENWLEIMVKMASWFLVDKLMKESGHYDSILERYHSWAISDHIGDRVVAKFRQLGLPVRRDTMKKQ